MSTLDDNIFHLLAKFYLCLLTPAAGLGYISTETPSLSSSVLGLTAADTIGPPQYRYILELETKVHPKVRNHGEGHYWGLLLVESGYYRFHI